MSEQPEVDDLGICGNEFDDGFQPTVLNSLEDCNGRRSLATDQCSDESLEDQRGRDQASSQEDPITTLREAIQEAVEAEDLEKEAYFRTSLSKLCILMETQKRSKPGYGVFGTPRNWIDTAETEAFKAQEVARRIPNKMLEALALNSLGQVHSFRGDAREAINRFEEAVRLFEEVGAEEPAASTYKGIAAMYFRTGQSNRSVDLLRKSIAIYERTGNQEQRLISEQALQQIMGLTGATGTPDGWTTCFSCGCLVSWIALLTGLITHYLI